MLNRPIARRELRGVFALLLAGCFTTAAGHNIPNDVTIQAMLKPEGNRLLLLARIPMAAIRDVTFPVRGAEGYLDIAAARPLLPQAAMLSIADSVELYEDDARLPKPRILQTRMSLPSDKSFASWEQALDHVNGPYLPDDTATFANQTMVDVLFEYPIHSDRARFSMDPDGLAYLGLRTVTALRFIPPGSSIRAFEYEGSPGLVHLDPRWYQAAERFVRMGFLHILDGTDHLLFLFCLVVPYRSLRALIPVITSFTVAHSVTLIASAYDYAPGVLWFPPLIELLIAVSIFYMAIENIVEASEQKAGGGQRRWLMAFGFGLVHGFGFSFALRQTLQFAGSHLLASLLSFNIGVELGQLMVLLLLIPALDLLFKFAMKERLGVIVLSAIAADIGGHWIVERWNNLRNLRIGWPEWSPALLLSMVQWTAALVIIGGLWRLAIDQWQKRQQSAKRQTPEAGL
jgi:uncharacterized protein (DUF2062 family)